MFNTKDRFWGKKIEVEKNCCCPNHGDSGLRCSSKDLGFAPDHRTLISPSTSLLSPWHRVIVLSTRIHRRHGWHWRPPGVFFGQKGLRHPLRKKNRKPEKTINWSTKWSLKWLRSCNKILLKERAIIYRSS